jgi:hypothetical protein
VSAASSSSAGNLIMLCVIALLWSLC